MSKPHHEYPFYCIPTKGRFAMGIAYIRVQSSTDVRLVFDDKGEREAPYNVETIDACIEDNTWQKVNDRKAEAFRLALRSVKLYCRPEKNFITQKAADDFAKVNSPGAGQSSGDLHVTMHIKMRALKDAILSQNFIKVSAEELAILHEALASWSTTGNMDGEALIDFNLSTLEARVREF